MFKILASLSLAVLLASPAVAQRSTCTFTVYGKSCGPVLTPKATPNGNTNKIELKLTNVKPGALLVIMVGGVKQDFDLRLMFGGTLDCRLLLVPGFMQFHRADANGTYSWGHALPSTWVGESLAQVAVLSSRTGQTVVTSSNGVELICK